MPKRQSAAKPPSEFIDKLCKICGMFGSDHDGERATAALKAFHMIRDSGLSWQDVLMPGDPSTQRVDEASGCVPINDLHPQDLMAECLQWRHVLTPWQRDFLFNVNRRLTQPSDKQLAILRAIAEIVWRAGGFR